MLLVALGLLALVVQPAWQSAPWLTTLAGAFLSLILWIASKMLRRPHYPSLAYEIGYAPEAPCKVGFSAKAVPDEVDAIVIGSGIGGLTAAGLLAKEGKKVLVLEQHDVAGGCTHTFEAQGFEFDTGLHYIGGDIGLHSSPLRKLLDHVSNGGVEWECMGEYFDEAVVCKKQAGGGGGGGDKPPVLDSFKISRDPETWRRQLMDRFPDEHEAIASYFAALANLKAVGPLYFILKFLPRWLGDCLFPVLGKPFHNYCGQTVEDVLSRLTSNRELIGVLSYCWGNAALPPGKLSFACHGMIVNHYMTGAYYPTGGSAQIARTIVPVITAAGGAVLVRAPVERIITEAGSALGVVVKGVHIHAEIIISAAGMSNTFQRLIKEPAALKLLQEQLSGLQSKGVEPSIPMVSLFVGLRGTPEELELPKRNFWCFPSWDHDQNCKDYEMGDVDSPPAFFVSFPAAKERTWVDRWGDKSVALVLAPAPYELFEKFEGGRVKHRGDEYLALKKRFENNLIAMLYTQLPQLKGKVAYVDVGSPLSNNYYLGTQRGEPYGLAATTERWADNGHWLRAQTPITGLYCCGADTLSPGVCGALTSGFFTAQAVCGLGFLVNHFELIA